MSAEPVGRLEARAQQPPPFAGYFQTFNRPVRAAKRPLRDPGRPLPGEAVDFCDSILPQPGADLPQGAGCELPFVVTGQLTNGFDPDMGVAWAGQAGGSLA